VEGEAAAPAAQPQAFSLNQDIVVYWRHIDGLPGSVDLVAYKPEVDQRGTFMLVVTPGDDLAKIEEGGDWIFVLDASGSMQGKYASLAEGVAKALGAMRPQDRFRIVLFNDGIRELTSGYVAATPENVNRYINEVAGIQPNGGTNLYAGLGEGLKRLEADRTSAIVLVTDGVANVGVTEQKSFVELVRQKDVRLFTFIMGNSANKPLLETLTQVSNGFAMNVSNSDDIVGRIMQAKSKVTHQAFHDVKVSIDGVRISDLKPGHIGSLYRGQQLVLFGHYWQGGPADVAVSGKISGRDTRYSTRFVFPETAHGNPEIERLWAYAAIEELDRQMEIFGENPDMRQAITDLAVEYGLVTDYTSMIVLREEAFQQHGIERRNRDRLALEQQAQQQRAQQPVQNRRVDEQKPMYQTNRPSFHGGGGGAFGPGLLLAGLFLLGIRKAKSSRAN
jgi:Ca-activated chloride channel family protein